VLSKILKNESSGCGESKLSLANLGGSARPVTRAVESQDAQLAKPKQNTEV
jgi:hypothetical protein